MVTNDEVRRVINDLFEQEALVIGGLVAVHRPDDDLVWRLVRNLDAVRRRFLRRIEAQDENGSVGVAADAPDLRPHPAIEDFLLTIRRAQP